MTRLTLLIVLGMTTLGGCQRAATPRSPIVPTTPSPAPSSVSSPVEGDYTITFIADDSCEQLPRSLRTRTYAATIRRDTGHFAADLSGANFYPYYDSFFLQFPISGGADVYLSSLYAALTWLDEYPIYERLASGGFLSIVGTTHVPFDFVNSAFAESATFDGAFAYCAAPKEQMERHPPACAQRVACESKNHVLRLARR